MGGLHNDLSLIDFVPDSLVLSVDLMVTLSPVLAFTYYRIKGQNKG